MRQGSRETDLDVSTTGSATSRTLNEVRLLYNELCVPSQSGAPALLLQPQKYSVWSLSAWYSTGVNSVSLWEPSQKG